jgi:hypothetical protein
VICNRPPPDAPGSADDVAEDDRHLVAGGLEPDLIRAIVDDDALRDRDRTDARFVVSDLLADPFRRDLLGALDEDRVTLLERELGGEVDLVDEPLIDDLFLLGARRLSDEDRDCDEERLQSVGDASISLPDDLGGGTGRSSRAKRER